MEMGVLRKSLIYTWHAHIVGKLKIQGFQNVNERKELGF